MSYKNVWFLSVILVTWVGVFISAEDIDPSRILNTNCSHSYEFCDRMAVCVNLTADTVYCKCPPNDPGDGLKNGTGCKTVDYTCVPQNVEKDCHPDAECINKTCKCNTGYQGNGKECVDIDECENASICSPYATCQDNKGSYTCTCKKGYVGDGVICKFKCTTNIDCAVNGKCNMDEECECKTGYIGDGVAECKDVDECVLGTHNCDKNALCTNVEGSFTCECNNGYAGDGVTCRVLPLTCDQIFQADINSESGIYEIDTDGTGQAKSIEVKCIMENGIGITVFWPKNTNVMQSPTTGNRVVEYDGTLDQIKPLVDNSAFCYQDVWFKCPSYFDLLEKVSWIDGEGNSQNSWGSVTKDTCACGVLGKCDGGNDCNCDGHNTSPRKDFGKLTTDNFKLPVESVNFLNSKTSASYTIGPLKCGPRPFDLPKNCHDAKLKMKLRENQPLLVDADGPEKPLAPFLIFCDVRTRPNFGVSIIPHDLKPNTEPADSGVIPLNYPASVDQINALVEGSVFCSQTVEYQCKNAPAGPVTAGKDNSALNYFPGGAADMQGSCACGLTGSCDVSSKKCNCDILDGEKRKDIGLVTDKDALPVISMDFTVGGDTFASITVGELKCSEQQFEIEPNCEKLRGIGVDYSYTYMIDPDGVGGQPPFPAQCIMIDSPPQGATVINHGSNDITDLSFIFLYKRASDDQIAGLKTRSTYCEQTITVECDRFPLHPTSVCKNRYSSDGYCRYWASIGLCKTIPGWMLYWCTNACGTCNGNFAYWLTQAGTKKYYFSGDGTKTNCDNENDECQCDKNAGGKGTDEGVLTNKVDLPVDTINFSPADSGGSITYRIGPLKCYETFPTCAALFYMSKRNAKKGETLVTSGQFTIDPDQVGGVDAFQVKCSFPLTVVDDVETGSLCKNRYHNDYHCQYWASVGFCVKHYTEWMEYYCASECGICVPDNKLTLGPGESQCFDVKYKDGAGKPITKAQIEALVKASGSCNQYLSYECENAPITGHVFYSKCESSGLTKMNGWAGSANKDKCQCGVTGTCDGGSDYLCNCDKEDDKSYKDSSFITSKNLLPVCQVCITVDGLPGNGTTPITSRKAGFSVGKLYCSSGIMGTKNNCQDQSLSTNAKSGNVQVDADGKGSGEDAFPVYCDITPYPQLGVLVIKPKEPEVIIPPRTYFNYTITYMIYRKDLIEKLIDNSVYCEQEISLQCVDSRLKLTDTFGWYGRDGKISPYWNKGETPCDGDGHNCQCNKGGQREDAGLIVDQSAIPVMQVVLGEATGTRKLVIGDVRCYEVYKDCYEIMKKHAKTRSSYTSNHTYVIDPDRAGGVKPFLVKCDFHDKEDYAVTEVIYEGGYSVVKNSQQPLHFKVPLKYPASTPKQSNELAKQSAFCYQGVQYECIQSPLMNNNNPLLSALELYGTSTMSFGKGDDATSIGCPCSVVGTCNLDGSGSDDSTCRCDNKGIMGTFDNGTFIDKSLLPVTGAMFGGQNSSKSSGKFKLGPMRCANKPFDIPEDCEEALEWGYTSGEYLIYPKDYVSKPFYVFCDMDINPKHGVIRVIPDVDDKIPVDGSRIDIPYHGLTTEELLAVVKISKYCYQPVKYDCQYTEFFGDGAATWSGPAGDVNRNFGSGAESSRQCSCGADRLCGGYDGKTKMRRRKCNCDIGDGEKRSDAGVMTDKDSLPITSISFTRFVTAAVANLTIGNFYCGTEPFDINECETGFNDCHELAYCRNTKGSYECICQKGYRGKISGISTEEVWANGRQCIDDDECSYNMCPSSAWCTNLPGSYNCTCKPGYIQKGFDVCEDINECDDPNLNDCDKNARCDNYEGGYSCACKRGYKDNGNATEGDCEPQGLCACYGDPHCISFDMKFLDFQGYCTYVMAQDGCTKGASQTFQVLIDTWNQNRPGITYVSWIKAVILKMKGLEFEIRQSKEILLNGALIRGYDDNGIVIGDTGLQIKVYTDFGLQVTWDGKSEVEVLVSKQYESKMCGLCGNFNFKDEDDWTLGPECPPVGSITTSENRFGHSWVVPSSLNDPNNKMCYKNCDEPPHKSECKMDVTMAYSICDAIFNINRSPFYDCLNKLDPAIVKKLRDDCKFDLCEVPDDISIGQCSAAERLIAECAAIGERAPIWRNKPGIYCEMECGKNMNYSICGGLNTTDPGPIVTCHHHLTNTNPEPLNTCIESCFCQEGFVRDADKCIKREECGCFEDGTYMSAGQIKVAEDCSYIRKCQANGHIFSNSTLKCHKNATCSVDKDTGIHGCNCKKGFMGDGIHECREDPCADVKCMNPNTMKCIEGECQCIMGFTGDCQQCFDIDECATNTHNCVHMGQKCVNRPGGFRCKCLPGFLPVGSTCADIDECDQNKNNDNFCGGNSECKNTPGSYECACCGGYKLGNNGCVLDGSGDDKVGDKHKCCSCYGPGCKENGQVCGTDGKTYPSLKSLIVRRCKTGNNHVGLSHEGPCPATCDNLECEKIHELMKCEVNPKTGTASCQCPKCKESEIETKQETVCASNKMKFESKCAFEAFACQVGLTKVTILPSNSTECGPGPGSGEPVSVTGPWGNCSNCGQGVQHREKKYTNVMDNQGNPFTIVEKRTCYKTCPDSPCSEEVCPPPSVCVFNDMNETSCVCPECTGWGSEPMCTTRGLVLMTYDNDCDRIRDACLLKEDIDVVSPVSCESRPLNCSKVINWVSKKEEDGCFSQYHDFGMCDGGCGSDPDECCEAKKYKEVEIEYFCPAGNEMRKKMVIEECECLSFEDLMKQKQGTTKPTESPILYS